MAQVKVTMNETRPEQGLVVTRDQIKKNPLAHFIALLQILRPLGLTTELEDLAFQAALKGIAGVLHPDKIGENEAFGLIQTAREAAEDPLSARGARRLWDNERQQARDRNGNLAELLAVEQARSRSLEALLADSNRRFQDSQAQLTGAQKNATELVHRFLGHPRTHLNLVDQVENPRIASISDLRSMTLLYFAYKRSGENSYGFQSELGAESWKRFARELREADLLEKPFLHMPNEPMRAAADCRETAFTPEEIERLGNPLYRAVTGLLGFLSQFWIIESATAFAVKIPVVNGRCTLPWGGGQALQIQGCFRLDRTYTSKEWSDENIPYLDEGGSAVLASQMEHFFPFTFVGGALVMQPVVLLTTHAYEHVDPLIDVGSDREWIAAFGADPDVELNIYDKMQQEQRGQDLDAILKVVDSKLALPELGFRAIVLDIESD